MSVIMHNTTNIVEHMRLRGTKISQEQPRKSNGRGPLGTCRELKKHTCLVALLDKFSFVIFERATNNK